jgi:hypothetical protein
MDDLLCRLEMAHQKAIGPMVKPEKHRTIYSDALAELTQLRAQIGTEIRTKGVVQQSHDWLYREKARLEATLRKIANPNTVTGMNDQDRAPKLQRIAQAAISAGTEAPNTQD